MRKEDSFEITEEYYDRLLIEMRALDCVEPDTHMTLFGQTFETPVMTAAYCILDMIRDNGYAEAAKGVADAGALMCMGFSKDSEYDLAVSAGLRPIRFIKPYRDRSYIYREMEYTASHGGLAVGMDIAHGFDSKGKPDQDHNRTDMYRDFLGITTSELESFTKASRLPFIAKDVLSVTDALKCRDAGCAGMVIGHHHSIMNCAVPPLMLLPRIREAVGPDMVLIVDGIYTGADAFKALALGADAVMAGRALLGEGFREFKESGAKAVCANIRRITEELAGLMAHTACAKITDIDPTLIHLKY